MKNEAKKTQWPEVISFRITETDRKHFEKLIRAMGTNKSEYLRKKLSHLLITFNLK